MFTGLQCLDCFFDMTFYSFFSLLSAHKVLLISMALWSHSFAIIVIIITINSTPSSSCLSGCKQHSRTKSCLQCNRLKYFKVVKHSMKEWNVSWSCVDIVVMWPIMSCNFRGSGYTLNNQLCISSLLIEFFILHVHCLSFRAGLIIFTLKL